MGRWPTARQRTRLAVDAVRSQTAGRRAGGEDEMARRVETERTGRPLAFRLSGGNIADITLAAAHSGERDQPFRLKVITDSGDRDHADHGRQKPGVRVAALHAADISIGCMVMVGPVKSAADRPWSPWRGPA